MKRISTLLASLILTVSVFAAARPKSTLTIQSLERTDMKVVIDGRRFEPANTNNTVTIRGLEAGNHQVKIYRQKNNGVSHIFGKKYEVVFNSVVSISSRSNALISIDRFGRATIVNGRNNGRSDRADNKDWNRNNDFDFDRDSRSGDYSNDRNDSRGDYDDHYGYESGMNDREFSNLLQSIQTEWLESNKLKSATHIVSSNRLSSAQVKQLVLLFSFESNKLDLAKQAYANTVDKRNYSMINDVFSFSSSRDELARFIRNIR